MNKTIHGRILMKRDTTDNWNKRRSFVPLEGEIIVYLDHDTDYDGRFIPAIKIGDGKAYLIDLPFVNDKILNELNNHINDTAAHITAEEREFWNNKLNSHVDGDALVLCNYEN